MTPYPPDDRRAAKLWVLRFIRLTFKAEVALDLGPCASLLLQYIAIGEDRCDFVKPPRYFAHDLRNACGCRDDEAFKRLRDRCVEAGWLVYEPGEIRQAGCFWVTVPAAYARLMESGASSGQTGSSPDHHRIITGSSPDPNRTMTGRRPAPDVVLSPLSPFPVPKGEGESGAGAAGTGGAPTHPPLGSGPDSTQQRSDDTTKRANAEALKRCLRRHGLSSAAESYREWVDLLQGAVGCRTLDECLWAIRWLIRTANDTGGVTVAFARHAGPYARACRSALATRREHAEEMTP